MTQNLIANEMLPSKCRNQYEEITFLSKKITKQFFFCRETINSMQKNPIYSDSISSFCQHMSPFSGVPQIVKLPS